MANCGGRAMTAGLRWAGFSEDEIEELALERIQTTDELKAIALSLGLDWCADGPVNPGNDPVLANYKSGFKGTDSEYHCVFLSDAAPLVLWEVHSLVVGWRELRESRS